MSAFHYRAEDAFHGPLGELAKRAEESIEVDSHTFLVQLLTAVGAMVGLAVVAACRLVALRSGPSGPSGHR